jgi:hypothetical protein
VGRARGTGLEWGSQPRAREGKKEGREGPRPAGPWELEGCAWGREKEGEGKGRGPGCREGKEKKGRGGELACWAGPKGEEWEREKERRKTNALEFATEI